MDSMYLPMLHIAFRLEWGEEAHMSINPTCGYLISWK